MGHISTSDLSCLLPAGKILLFKNGLEVESIFYEVFTCFLQKEVAFILKFSPAHHLMQVSCGPEKNKEYTCHRHLVMDLQK